MQPIQIRAATLRVLKQLLPEWCKSWWREWRWPRWSLRWLPGSSISFGPARRWTTLRAYLSRHPGQLQEVLPELALPEPKPTIRGAVAPRFLSRFQNSVPPAAVFTLPDARLLAADGWVVGAADSYLVDASYWAYPDKHMRVSEHYMLRRRRAPGLRTLPGHTLSLASDFAIGGFGHWLHDSLARLHLVELAGCTVAQFDWVYWPCPDSTLARQLVAEVGIDPGKLLGHDKAHDLQCQMLTATTFPGRPGQFSREYANFIRSRFARHSAQRNRRIYLSRRGYRRNVSNQVEFIALLEQHGFEEVLADREVDIRDICAAAALVISAEGANFFNVVFCAPGTRVLLIVPDRLHAVPYAMTMAEAAGLRTWLMAGRSLGSPETDGGTADFEVDLAVLGSAIEDMLNGQVCRFADGLRTHL